MITDRQAMRAALKGAGSDELSVVQRTTRVVDLRRRGLSFREIGERVRVSAEQCRQDWLRAIEGAADPVDRREAAFEELDRLGSVIHAHWQQMVDGDFVSAGVVLRSIELRCKIQNLFAPATLEVHVTAGEVIAQLDGLSDFGRLAIEGDVRGRWLDTSALATRSQ